MSPTNRATGAAGYTLLELLVVLLILGLVVGLTTPFLSPERRQISPRQTALTVAAGLRFTRGQAIKTNRDAVFVLDTARRGYKFGVDGELVELPPDIEFSLVTARSERIDSARGGIRFFADGSSTGGGVTISGPGEKYQVTVDWLTGRVRIGDE